MPTFVQDKQLAPAHDGSRERDDLPLPDGQIPAPARDIRIERQARACRLSLPG